jgi:hypothetical protein
MLPEEGADGLELGAQLGWPIRRLGGFDHPILPLRVLAEVRGEGKDLFHRRLDLLREVLFDHSDLSF